MSFSEKVKKKIMITETKTVEGKQVKIIAGGLILFGLYLTGLYNYLLFHSLAEIFSIVVAFGIFVVAWHSRRMLDNNYLLFIGIGYLFVGGLDLSHTLAYKGMGVFQGYGANPSTQLWIAARYVESLTLFIAPLVLDRKLRFNFVLLCYALVVIILLGSIFYWNIFPVCYVEGIGLTPFKKISEYLISLILAGSIVLLNQKRKEFERDIFRLLVASIIITIGAELAFTFYVSVYGLFSLIGHYFKMVSFYLIYKAVVSTGIESPADILFFKLKQSEKALRESEHKYKTLTENSLAGIYIHQDDKYVFVNERFAEMCGYTPDELLGKNHYDLTHPDQREMIQQRAYRRLAGEKVPQRYEILKIRKNGEAVWHEVMASDPIEYHGKPAIMGHEVDISRRKQAEEALHKAYDELELRIEERTAELMKANEQLNQKIEERKQVQEALQESEKRYRSLVEMSPEAIFVQIEGKIVYINSAGTKIYGATNPAEITGRSIFDFVHPDYNEIANSRIEQIYKERKKVPQSEMKVIRLDGRVIEVETTGIYITYSGKPAVLSVVRDVTEQKEANRKLRENEAKLQELFDEAPAGYHEYDTKGRITRVNRTELEMLGYRAEEMLGRYVWEFIVGEEISREAVEAKLIGAKPVGGAFERTMRRKDGTEVPILVEDRILKDEQGRSMGIRSTVQDISDLKQAQEALRESEAQLQQVRKMEAIGTLAGGIAHEFNNALGSITMAVGLIEKNYSDHENMAEYIETLKASADRMVLLIRHLLAYAEKGKYTAEIVSLNDLAEDALTSIRHTISPSIRVETNLAHNIFNIEANPTQIKMMMSAVVANAAEATEGPGRIRILTGNEAVDEEFAKTRPDAKPGRYACLSIEDEGKGMDEETKARLFDPFFSSRFQGRGLGMAAVYGIVKNHGGWISIDSEPGRGTAVRIFLPAVDARAEESNEAKKAISRRKENILPAKDKKAEGNGL